MNIHNLLHNFILSVLLLSFLSFSLKEAVIFFRIQSTYFSGVRNEIKIMSKNEKRQCIMLCLFVYAIFIVIIFNIVSIMLNLLFDNLKDIHLITMMITVLLFILRLLFSYRDHSYRYNLLYKRLLTSEKNFYFKILNKYFKCVYINESDGNKEYSVNVYSSLLDGEFIFNYIRKNKDIATIVDKRDKYVTFEVGLYVVTILKYCNLIVIMDKDAYIETLINGLKDKNSKLVNKIFTLKVDTSYKNYTILENKIFMTKEHSKECLLNLLYNLELKKRGDSINNYPHNSQYIKKYKEKYKNTLDTKNWVIDIRKVKSEIYSLYFNKVDISDVAKNFITNSSDIIAENNKEILHSKYEMYVNSIIL